MQDPRGRAPRRGFYPKIDNNITRPVSIQEPPKEPRKRATTKCECNKAIENCARLLALLCQSENTDAKDITFTRVHQILSTTSFASIRCDSCKGFRNYVVNVTYTTDAFVQFYLSFLPKENLDILAKGFTQPTSLGYAFTRTTDWNRHHPNQYQEIEAGRYLDTFKDQNGMIFVVKRDQDLDRLKILRQPTAEQQLKLNGITPIVYGSNKVGTIKSDDFLFTQIF